MDLFGNIPEEYKTHLPKETTVKREIYGEVAEKAGEVAIEPFLKIGEGIKDSLRRIYAVASQPLGAEAPVRPRPFAGAPVEFLASLAGYVVALPIKAVKEVIEGGEKALRGAEMLRGGARGELGEWTSQQAGVASEALNLTIGAMVGGGPGAGTGVANIGRKDALKMLAKEFRGMKKVPGQKEYTEQFFSRYGFKPEPFPSMEISSLAKKGYRTVAKGMQDIPQDVLDMVKEVGLAPTHRTDIAGRFKPKTSRVEYQIAKHLPKETIPHEFLHAMQLKKIGHAKKGVPTAVLEAHAYEFEGLFMREVAKLPKGKQIDMSTFERIYSEAFRSMTEKYGTDFSKYKMKDIVSRAHMERKWSGSGKLRERELRSEAPREVGEMVELPGGKVRYDGEWEAFGSRPQTYQYTFHEGIAKGDTFVSPTQRMRDIAEAGMRKVKMRSGGKKGGN